MSELQASDSGITFDDSPVQDVQEEQQESTEVVESSDLAPDSPEEGKENTTIAKVDGVEVEGPEGFKKAIDKQHRKFREEQRRAQDLEKRLQELESKSQVSTAEITIPPIPDSWDDDLEVKIKQRDEAILRKAQNDALIAQQKEQQVSAERERQRQDYEQAQKLQSQFSENGKKLGIGQDELIRAQNAIVDYGVTPELAKVLLDDPEGPILALHFEANILDLHDIVSADPLRAGMLLANAKNKAAALKPKYSKAPPPAADVSGRAAPKKDRGPKGATYE